MVSARRHRRVMHKKRVSWNPILKYLVLILIPLIAFLFVRLTTKHWNGKDKVSVVFQKSGGDVGLTLLDPKLKEITTFTIPGNTEVEVARNLGSLKIQNIWQLGMNEKLGGGLLAQTVTKDFLFPTVLWTGSVGESLSDGNFVEILKFIFTRKDTNIAFGDRVSIGIFVLKARSNEKSDINLGKSQFLVKAKLSDGSLGYKIPGEISERITFYFSDNDFSQTGIKIYIKDSTGKFGVAERVGQIVEVMGGKVVNLEKGPDEESDCSIWGQNESAVKKISKIFGCKVTNEKSDFDVQISLGTTFAKRF
ncbi:MAG: hypothetical protein ACHQUA_01530 [Microgenomates group bacterium]